MRRERLAPLIGDPDQAGSTLAIAVERVFQGTPCFSVDLVRQVRLLREEVALGRWDTRVIFAIGDLRSHDDCLPVLIDSFDEAGAIYLHTGDRGRLGAWSLDGCRDRYGDRSRR